MTGIAWGASRPQVSSITVTNQPSLSFEGFLAKKLYKDCRLWRKGNIKVNLSTVDGVLVQLSSIINLTDALRMWTCVSDNRDPWLCQVRLHAPTARLTVESVTLPQRFCKFSNVWRKKGCSREAISDTLMIVVVIVPLALDPSFLNHTDPEIQSYKVSPTNNNVTGSGSTLS